ncbi:hypothetical protein N0V90_005182 [Kalmusia sp. IMI 367209]|nr:hypothetical protein N0V90_005182 [Kalmusia sp. IMI 367209]
MSFRYGPNVHADRPTYVASISDKQVVKDGLKRLEIPNWKHWASQCNEKNIEQEFLYATILMCTPNVTRLEIDDGTIREEETGYKVPKWLKLIQYASNGNHFGRTHQFNQLASFHIDLQFLKLRHLAPIFKLQSMRKVTLIGLVEWAETKEGEPGFLRRLLAAGTSSVEELRLQKSFVHSDVLDVLISSACKLRVFEYQSADDRFPLNGEGGAHYWYPIDQRVEYDWDSATNSYKTIIRSLETHCLSLETLRLRQKPSAQGYIQHTGVLETVGRFENLAHLEAPINTLTVENSAENLVEKLPRSLQTLSTSIVWGVHPSYKPALDNLALCCREYLPSLQLIRLEPQIPLENRNWNWEQIRKSLLDQAIRCEIQTTYIDDDSGDWDSHDDELETDSVSSSDVSLYSE